MQEEKTQVVQKGTSRNTNRGDGKTSHSVSLPRTEYSFFSLDFDDYAQ